VSGENGGRPPDRKAAFREIELDLLVTRHEVVAVGVVAVDLADPAGGELPPWTPGAHIDIVCGYHGCVYDPLGNCIKVPSQPMVPVQAFVQAFPVVERAPFVWIWLGDPLAASLRNPPSLPWQTGSDWVASLEVSHVDANFLLLHEHYLDLTHMFVVHPETIPPGITDLPPMEDVEVSETSVSYYRDLPPAPLAEWERQATRLAADGRYRRSEQGRFVSPALHAGRYTIHGDDGSTYDHLRTQAFTPETPTSTHVFLQVARNYSPERGVLSGFLHAMFSRMAVRDRQILEVIEAQRRNAEALGAREVNVIADRAATRARKIVHGMVADEMGRALTRPGRPAH
jgi:phenylpropionate dioxygenase-like ring-hydroxylating dioxygenase large terminal subunit